MYPFRTPLALAIGTLLLVPLLTPLMAEAQRTPWRVSANLGGNFFFGNRDQTTFSAGGEIERSDQVFESSTSFRFNYGTSTDSEGVTSVSRRSWTANGELGFRPRERWQPFVEGNMHSSFERRIALRYDTGAGVRMSFRDPDNRRNQISFSLSVLAERTYATPGARGTTPDDVSLTRWSSNFRVRRQILGDRLYVDSNNSYRPVFDSFGRFRLNSTNTFSYDLTEVVSLRFRVRGNYDSRQRARGADTNWDGNSEITLAARF
jgi:hypothetical protein